MLGEKSQLDVLVEKLASQHARWPSNVSVHPFIVDWDLLIDAGDKKLSLEGGIAREQSFACPRKGLDEFDRRKELRLSRRVRVCGDKGSLRIIEQRGSIERMGFDGSERWLGDLTIE
jgi:hypothetical protein